MYKPQLSDVDEFREGELHVVKGSLKIPATGVLILFILRRFGLISGPRAVTVLQVRFFHRCVV